MRIYSTEQLGPKQSLTPEGYLLCEAVPIARTGTQVYAEQELVGIEAGIDGLITVIREESEVFSPETMASFEGKSVTVGHAFVDPESWSALTKGTVQNVRRGKDADSDLLIADLLITDAGTIDLVRVELDDKGRPVAGQITIREVSCGYDAEYEQERPGVAYQRNIIGNHVALVERGRAGPRCSIQDEEIQPMTTKANVPLLQRMLTALRSKDAALQARIADAAEEEVEAEKKKVEDEEAEEARKKTEDTLARLTATVDALTAAVAKIGDSMGGGAGESSTAETVETGTNPTGDEEGEEDKDDEAKKKTADAMRDTASRAEILVPGFKLPTADSAVKNINAVVAVQRKVLADAIKTADGEKLVAPLLMGKTVSTLTADAVSTVFVAASELARVQNNSRGARQGVATKDSGAFGVKLDNAAINAKNAEFWAQQ